MEQDATLKKSFSKYITVTNVLAVLLVISIGTGVYFYQKATADPQKEALKELQATIVSVGKLMVLPAGETPTMATVSDPEKLKDQPFFIHAQKGDKVLIYTASQKAILYSPSLNKIVEVAPINAGATGGSANVPL
ncbi:MAG: hypothetical protein WAW90_00035 [Minisyncoccia bacterium]